MPPVVPRSSCHDTDGLSEQLQVVVVYRVDVLESVCDLSEQAVPLCACGISSICLILLRIIAQFPQLLTEEIPRLRCPLQLISVRQRLASELPVAQPLKIGARWYLSRWHPYLTLTFFYRQH